MISGQGYTLLGDQPSEDGQDPLGFEQLAGDLAQLIRASAQSTPFTLGIQAGWGEGKSSLMGRLRRHLIDHPDDGGPDVKVARFNAWSAGEDAVQEGLIRTVLLELDEKVLDRAAKKRKLIALAKLGTTAAATPVGGGGLINGLWGALATDPTARNQMGELMAAAMEDWRSDGDGDGERLLVVLIDDLDRCTAGSVVQVFEAMKLYLDAPGIAFVVGFDSGVVSDAVQSFRDLDEDEATRYLEKVIHVHYPIQPAGESQVRALLRDYIHSSGTEELFDEALQTLVAEHNARNPRRIKGFINNFIVEYRTDAEWQALDAGVLVRWLVLRAYFRQFAKLFYDRRDREPISELLDLVAAREFVARPGAPDVVSPDWVDNLFASYELPLPSENGSHAMPDALEALEAALPAVIPPLAADEDFVSLVEGFGDGEARVRFREKLQRRGILDLYADDEAYGLRHLKGMDIVWISDARTGDESVFEELKYLGVRLRTADSFETARISLIERTPDAIVSDITRQGDELAGFTDLAHIQELGYTVPVIFYTSRISAQRAERAEALNALITTSPSELFELLATIGRTRSR